MTSLGLGATLIPKSSLFARNIPLDAPWSPGDVAMKKQLADVALNAAKNAGILAAQILSTADEYLVQNLIAFKEKLKQVVEASAAEMEGK